MNFSRYIVLALKGCAMGMADVVPGVSGGTIAFISGIYEELLDSIRSVNATALKLLLKLRLGEFWRHINGSFLLPVLLGIAIAIFSLARLMTYLLTYHPIAIWSFFFGLIIASALLVALLSQSLLRIDGLRLTDVEPLLQLRQTGTPLGLRGLLVAGVVISALGAVMDVAMSISSALTEVHTVAPDRDGRALFRSGMNIGRDMVGTMTNTLILAFLGSGLSFIIYLYSLGLDPRQLISSPYMATEVISGIASSIGVILAVPLTALITSFILVKDKKPKAPCGSKPEDKKLPKEVQ